MDSLGNAEFIEKEKEGELLFNKILCLPFDAPYISRSLSGEGKRLRGHVYRGWGCISSSRRLRYGAGVCALEEKYPPVRRFADYSTRSLARAKRDEISAETGVLRKSRTERSRTFEVWSTYETDSVLPKYDNL